MLDNEAYFKQAIGPEIDQAFSAQQVTLNTSQIILIRDFVFNEYVEERKLVS